ncbi:MAG: 50S ribosomal protein L9 [Candidatus Riflebacteria bacterium]|nr:50S ribosomal protein L9 [Candidatus Riflebacteria bacterium]
MEVILIKDVDALGGKNEVVKVKDGFARNYLFPNKLAILASPGNVKSLREKIRLANEAKSKRIESARELADKLSKLHIEVVKKAGKEGKLFGSVTSQEIVDKIKALSGIEMDKRRVPIPAHLKTVGQYTVACRLEVGVTATLHLDVRSDEPIKPAEEVAAEAMPDTEAGSVPRSRKKAGPDEETPEAVAAEPEVKADDGKAKKPRRKSEAEAQLPEDAAPAKKKKKKGINEAEAELPD